MINSRVSICVSATLALAALAGQPSTGFAADLGYGGSIKDAPPPPPAHRTWYLKGTIGAGNYFVDEMTNEVYANGQFTVGHTDMKSAPFFGLGIGVERGRWFRFDVTGEYRGKWLFIGQDKYDNGGCVGGPGPGCGTNEFTGDMEAWVGMANAYIDVGTFRGITPYVGAGVGLAHLSLLGLKDVNVPANSVAFGGDNSTTNFAWALYAGLSYDVTPQFTVDLGYRYLDMGDIKSGPVVTYDGVVAYSGQELKDITSHDLMLSLRYRLDSPEYYPVAIK